jgi:hypothetical protein
MALPRIAAPDGAGVRINDALQKWDTNVEEEIQACRTNDPRKWFWERQVQVSMTGPAYLSILLKDFSYCLGPYPSTEEYALVYDLPTGKLVRWSMLLPAVSVMDEETQSETVSSVGLTNIYLRERELTLTGADWEKECTEALSSSEWSFLLWPDGKDGALHMKPANLPHVIQTCGGAVALGDSSMRELGLSEKMRQAMEEAHRLSTK